MILFKFNPSINKQYTANCDDLHRWDYEISNCLHQVLLDIKNALGCFKNNLLLLLFLIWKKLQTYKKLKRNSLQVTFRCYTIHL